MAAVLKVTPPLLLTNLSRISFQAVRGKLRDHPHRRKHEYEFIENKNMYPNEPCVRHGKLQYYPRHPNYQDPPYQPTKLIMIQRVKPLKGTPYYDLDVLARLGLDSEDMKRVVIHKNTEYICENLWKIKHLVKVTPITFPNGEPTEEDLDRTVVTANGEMIVSDVVRADPRRVEAQEKFQQDPLRLDGNTLREQSRAKWVSGWLA